LANFSRSKTRHLLTTNHHESTTKAPAIYHVLARRIPATPLKNARKNSVFGQPRRPKRKLPYFEKKEI
jgi:hypothetical protein